MAKIYGQLEKAQLENLAVDPSPGKAGGVHFNTADEVAKLDDGSALHEITTNDQTQTLTNKTLTAPVISTISNTGTVTLPTATCTLVGKDTTDTLTNKTIDADGTGNSITNLENENIKAGAAIDASKIADGSVSNTEFQYISTLSSNAQTQLDAKVLKSTYSAKGSILAATAASTPADLTVGANGTVLTADSGESTGVKWATVSVTPTATRSVSSTDTATAADDTLILSGASFTQTLFTAAGNSGKTITLIHAGTSLTQVYTLATTGGQTIGGVASGSYALYTNGETVTVISDGSNWLVLDHKTTTPWVSWTPTGDFTNTTYTGFYRRHGDSVDLKIRATCTGTPGAATFSVDLVNMTIDTAKLLSTTQTKTPFLSTVIIDDNSASTYKGQLAYDTTTSFRVVSDGALSNNNVAALTNTSIGFTFAVNDFIEIHASGIPISGWQP